MSMIALSKINIYNKNNNYPNNSIYIGRGSILGNPFSHIPNKGKFPVDTREEAIVAYQDWLEEKLEDKTNPIYQEIQRLKLILKETGELNLLCYCVPLPCHGNIIAKIIKEYND